jgi:hypothetical protein
MICYANENKRYNPMNVTELYGLAEWFKAQYNELAKHYNALYTTLNHNATQPNQQPVESVLNDLISFLKGMNLGELSLQQLGLLADLKVENLLGPLGAQNISEMVKTASYDPASTANKLQAAANAIGQAQQHLTAYSVAVNNLGISPDVFNNEDGLFVVRVGFRNEASIENVVDWKNSSEEWYHIIRGLALVAGEAPEQTKIVGVANGSIILILAATCAVTSLLARIAKHITSTARDVVSLETAQEDLRQKRILTKVMESEFSKQQKKAREDGMKAINEELATAIPADAPGDAKNALEKSIEKLLKFGEDGGDLDFVVPPEIEEGGAAREDATTAPRNDIEQLRKIVHDYQDTRESLKLLEHSQNENTV